MDFLYSAIFGKVLEICPEVVTSWQSDKRKSVGFKTEMIF